MRNVRQIIHLFCLLLGVIFASACAKNTLTSSWVDQSFKGPIKGRILVIGVFKYPTTHKIFEDSFVNSLVKSGMDAVPSYTYKQTTERHSKEWLRQTVKQSGAAVVLITHLNHEKKQIENHESHGLILGGAMYGNDVAGYHAFVAEKTLVPGSFETKTVDYIDASLFDCQTNKPIWSVSSKRVNLNHLLRTDDEQLENLYIEDMKRNDLL